MLLNQVTFIFECFYWLKPLTPTFITQLPHLAPPTKPTPTHYKFRRGLTHSLPNWFPKSHTPTTFRSVRSRASPHRPLTSQYSSATFITQLPHLALPINAHPHTTNFGPVSLTPFPTGSQNLTHPPSAV